MLLGKTTSINAVKRECRHPLKRQLTDLVCEGDLRAWRPGEGE
jgi:hypothetical protein